MRCVQGEGRRRAVPPAFCADSAASLSASGNFLAELSSFISTSSSKNKKITPSKNIVISRKKKKKKKKQSWKRIRGPRSREEVALVEKPQLAGDDVAADCK